MFYQNYVDNIRTYIATYHMKFTAICVVFKRRLLAIVIFLLIRGAELCQLLFTE